MINYLEEFIIENSSAHYNQIIAFDYHLIKRESGNEIESRQLQDYGVKPDTA